MVVGGNDWISDGLTGIVLRHGNAVLKIPKVRNTSGLSGYDLLTSRHLNEYSLRCHDTEVQVYKRLGRLSGIIECFSASHSGIKLMYMRNGNLEKYMERCHTSHHLKIQWIWTIVDTVYRLHDKRIVMLDLAARNILVDEDLSLKLCDFGNVLLLPAHADISKAQRDGLLSVEQDIYDLGWILYSIGIERACHSRLTREYLETDREAGIRIDEYEQDTFNGVEDVEDEAGCANETEAEREPTLWPLVWPHSLPDTNGILCGDIIRKCWEHIGYQSTAQIRDDIYAALCCESQEFQLLCMSSARV